MSFYNKPLLNLLIDIGNSKDIKEKIAIELINFSESDLWSLQTMPLSAWEEIDSLEDSDILALIKVFTLMNKGGSVSSVIWLYKILESKYPSLCTDIANWVLLNSNNMYEPFGTYNFGAKSFEEYQKNLANEHLRKANRYKEIEDNQIKAKNRSTKDATEKIFKAIARRDKKAIEALISKGADIYSVNSEGKTAFELAQEFGIVLPIMK